MRITARSVILVSTSKQRLRIRLPDLPDGHTGCPITFFWLRLFTQLAMRGLGGLAAV
jgi:hypothetical protein